MKTWTDQDFESMGWHDNHVHAFAIREGEHGTGELILDLDYILEWTCPTGENRYQFLMSPATLTFIGMTDLKMTLDYTKVSAGTCPFSVDGIERSLKSYESGYSSYAWRIPINWPNGELSFVASGYKQVLRAEPVWSNEMYLNEQERVPM
jgi:hypothetical protein